MADWAVIYHAGDGKPVVKWVNNEAEARKHAEQLLDADPNDIVWLLEEKFMVSVSKKLVFKGQGG